MISFRPVGEDNFTALLRMTVPEPQCNYIAPNSYSLAECWACRDRARPYAIYEGERLVGFIMAVPDNNVFGIWRLMIAPDEQRRGFGRAALMLAAGLGVHDGFATIDLDYVPENTVAERLYRSIGFAETGELDGREIIMALTLDQNTGLLPICAEVEQGERGFLVWARDYPGVYGRGQTMGEAVEKLRLDLVRWFFWSRGENPRPAAVVVETVKKSALKIEDADSDIILAPERLPLSGDEYLELRELALRSAGDFLTLYRSCEPDLTNKASRETFYGPLPTTPRAMYEHTRRVNSYYFGELGIEVGDEPDILSCRQRGFELLGQVDGFLARPPVVGSFGEEWSLRKLLRRFIWHDRIHARAMWRLAVSLGQIPADPYGFGV